MSSNISTFFTTCHTAASAPKPSPQDYFCKSTSHIWKEYNLTKLDSIFTHNSIDYYDHEIACKHCSFKTLLSSKIQTTGDLNKHTLSQHNIRYSKGFGKKYERVVKPQTKKPQPTLITLQKNKKDEAYRNTTNRRAKSLQKFFLECGIPVSHWNNHNLRDAMEFEKGEFKFLSNDCKLHDSYSKMAFAYRLNLHNLLQDVPTVDLVFDLWQSGDCKKTWFLCSAVAFTDKNYKNQFHILGFTPINKSGHDGKYIADQIKDITDKYNISKKIYRIVLDSASNNLAFAEHYKDMIDLDARSSPFKEFFKEVEIYVGKSSLVRCSSHFIHNAIEKFIRNFKKILINSYPALDNDLEISESVEQCDKDMNIFVNNYNLEFANNEIGEEITVPTDNQVVSNYDKHIGEEEIDDFQESLVVNELFTTHGPISTTGAPFLLDKLRNVIKHIRYYDDWSGACSDVGIKEKKLLTDVKTRWSSFYIMLNRAMEYKNAILKYCLDNLYGNDLRTKPLTEADFKTLSSLRDLLKPLFVLTSLSSSDHTSISCWKEILRTTSQIFAEYKNLTLDDNLAAGMHANDLIFLRECAALAEINLEDYHTAALVSKPLVYAEIFNPIMFYVNFVKADHGLKDTDMSGNQKTKTKNVNILKEYQATQVDDETQESMYFNQYSASDDNESDEYSTLIYRLDDLKNELIDETINEIKREINHHLFSNSKLANSDEGMVRGFDDIDELVKMRKIVQDELKDHLKLYNEICGNNVSADVNPFSRSFSVSRTLGKFQQVSASIDSSCESIDEYKNFLSKSTRFGNSEDSDIFDSEIDIQRICTVEWALRRTVKKEIEKYEECVSERSFLIKAFPKLQVSDNATFEEKEEADTRARYPWYYFDPNVFWKEKSDMFPYLSKLARRCIGCTSSSAPIERIFSVATNYFPHRRTTFDPGYVECLMLLRMNGSKGNEIPVDEIPDLEEFKKQFGNDHPLANTAVYETTRRYNKPVVSNDEREDNVIVLDQ